MALNKNAKILNKLLTPAGLELRSRPRTQAEHQNVPRNETSGRIIEFVGTRGIGKTTLNNEIQQRLKHRWFFRSELEQMGPTTALDSEIQEFHRKLYTQRVELLNKATSDFWHSITLTKQAVRVISESLTTMASDFPRGFFLDEGLIKNFSEEVLSNSDDVPESLWTGRALIHLRARDSSLVVERYLKRVSERKQHSRLLPTPSKEQLTKQIEKDNNLYDQLLLIAHNCGCDTLTIYAEDPHDENVARILEFERSLFATPQS